MVTTKVWPTDRCKERQIYTFDDLEKYTHIRWNGSPGYILDKGEHVVEKVDDGRHIHIEYEKDSGETRTVNIHENMVNKYLRQRKKIWVDFGNKLYGSSD